MSVRGTVPLSASYLNVQEARASAALLGAGAWDVDADLPILPCPYFENATVNFTYTPGAAGGAFDFQLEYSPYSVAANVPVGAQQWMIMPLYASGAVVAGADTTSAVQRELITYEATGVAVETFPYSIILSATIERLRMRARESGVVGDPGTLQAQAVFS